MHGVSAEGGVNFSNEANCLLSTISLRRQQRLPIFFVVEQVASSTLIYSRSPVLFQTICMVFCLFLVNDVGLTLDSFLVQGPAAGNQYPELLPEPRLPL